LTAHFIRSFNLLARALALAISVVALVTAFAMVVQAADNVKRLPTENVTVSTSGGDFAFVTELATNDSDRSVGLMFRRSLGAREAMLFYWAEPEPVAMWMRNTYIPLDMLFVAADGTVVHVANDAVPHSLKTITANQDVSAVMEINAGTAAKLNIKTGSRLLHRFFNRS
jgi:uncharacterized membrane protein (UPF0127 family)